MTITLSNSTRTPKLVARLYSAGQAFDPTTMSVWAKTNFLVSWWWVGFATFPRTVKEAWNLLVRKGMPWAFRPEPRKETMARKADDFEVMVEKHFHAYIRQQVASSPEAISLRYIPAGLIGPEAKEVLIASPAARIDTPFQELRVLTPLFYSRLPQYALLSDALTSECFSGTITLSPSVFNIIKCPKVAPKMTSHLPLGFHLLSLLRRRPSAIPIPESEKEERATTQLSFCSHPSEATGTSPSSGSLDAYVLSTASQHEWRAYFQYVVKRMIANWVAGGIVEVLDLFLFMVRIGVLRTVVGIVFR